MSDIKRAREELIELAQIIGDSRITAIVNKYMHREKYTPGTRGPVGERLSYDLAKIARRMMRSGYKIDFIRSELQRVTGKKFNIGRISEALHPERKKK